jgi:O-acetyl-ADP-ribose deacetylase (regulator of RNase III)
MNKLPKVFLRDVSPELVKFWKKYFRCLDVDISQGDIFDIKADAIVSPANSFGFMDGGIDLAYRNKFGLPIEKLVQKTIKARYYDELPVGQALAIPTRNKDIPNLIVAPTMRIPMVVDNTLNPYYAFRAALLTAKEHSITSLLCPGLGTGAGKACPEMVARQMFVAYFNVVLEIGPVKFEHIQKQNAWMLRCSQTKV